jgi:hypothetical protein
LLDLLRSGLLAQHFDGQNHLHGKLLHHPQVIGTELPAKAGMHDPDGAEKLMAIVEEGNDQTLFDRRIDGGEFGKDPAWPGHDNALLSASSQSARAVVTRDRAADEVCVDTGQCIPAEDGLAAIVLGHAEPSGVGAAKVDGCFEETLNGGAWICDNLSADPVEGFGFATKIRHSISTESELFGDDDFGSAI